jgi:hypothetical protein
MTLARQLIERHTEGGQRGRSVTVNLAESPLSWLRARKLVTARQFAAGEALRSDWERAALGPSVTMRWDASGVKACHGAAPDPSQGHLGAKARFDAALASAGPSLSDVLWRTVCAGESLPHAERTLGWPARSGRLILTLALDRVADYYRLPGAESHGKSAA